MRQTIVRLWKVLTYRNGPAVFPPPPRRPVAAGPVVEEWEGELLLLEVDPQTQRVRIAAVRRPGR